MVDIKTFYSGYAYGKELYHLRLTARFNTRIPVDVLCTIIENGQAPWTSVTLTVGLGHKRRRNASLSTRTNQ